MFRLATLTLVIVFVLLAGVSASAAPLFAPCVAGAAYDPACDVDHDGDVDVFDIQKTAGHWGQSGLWISDNNHNHLGQTWWEATTRSRSRGPSARPTMPRWC